MKGTIQKVVKCSQVDLANGALEYFVVNRGKHRGCWLSSDAVDASTFIIHQHEKISVKRERRIQEMKEEEEKRLREEAAAEAAALKRAAREREEKAAAQKRTEAAHKRTEAALKAILKRHEIKIQVLMKECKDKGLTMVPTKLVKPWRDQHFSEMRKAIEKEKLTKFDPKTLPGRLAKAEADGTKAYISELQSKIQEANRKLTARSKLTPSNIKASKKG